MNDSRSTMWPSCVGTILSFGVILAVVALAGCATTERVVTKMETRTVEVPPSLLRCLPEPQAREAWRTQRDVALSMLKLSEAGEDCRLKLDAVRKLLEARE